MPLIEYQQQRTTQPQGALRFSTAARPPIAVAVPRAGGMLIEARGLAERMGVASGTGVRVAAGPLGLAAGSATASINSFRLHSVANQTNTVWERPSAALTMMAVVLRRGNSTGNASIFGSQSPYTSPYTAYAIVDGSGIGTHRSEISTGTGTTSLDTDSIPTGTPCVLVSTYDGAALRNYRNGVEVGSVAKTGTLVYPSGADRGPAVGNFYDYPDQARSFVGDIYLVALWDVALSAAEVAILSRSPQAPWQLFAPETRRIWVPSAGGGVTATLTGAAAASAAGTITATGAARATISGASAAASAGTVTARVPATATITGASATASAGAVASFGAASIALTGASASASVGALSATGAAQIAIPGAAAAASAGTVSASAGGSAVATLPGASAATSAGMVTATGAASIALTGAGATAAAGIIAASEVGGGAATATLTGTSATASAGAVTARGAANVALPSAAAIAACGTVAAFSGGAAVVTDPSRLHRLPPESRMHALAAEVRTHRLPPESRIYRATKP